jgi:hypothetical protein
VTARRRRSELPERLGSDVERELARLGQAPAGHGDMAGIVAAWPSAVGEAISRNAWPARFARDGTLIVHTSSSAWAFELEQLSASIGERLGAQAPVRMRFVVGPLAEPGHETVKEVEKVSASPGAAEWAEATAIARTVEAPGLREAVARAAAASLARARAEARAGRGV